MCQELQLQARKMADLHPFPVDRYSTNRNVGPTH